MILFDGWSVRLLLGVVVTESLVGGRNTVHTSRWDDVTTIDVHYGTVFPIAFARIFVAKLPMSHWQSVNVVNIPHIMMTSDLMSSNVAPLVPKKKNYR